MFFTIGLIIHVGVGLRFSLFNLISLSLFIPVIQPFTRWIGNFFQDENELRHLNLADVSVKEPEVALATLRHTPLCLWVRP
ncbi:hypothetical protein GCM10027217_12330 [Pseudomaricurvus hydrocarbonicus]